MSSNTESPEREDPYVASPAGEKLLETSLNLRGAAAQTLREYVEPSSQRPVENDLGFDMSILVQAKGEGPLSSMLFDGARITVRYFCDRVVPYLARTRSAGFDGQRPLAGFRVIELGAGTGAVSWPLALLGAEVVVTDQETDTLMANFLHLFGEDARGGGISAVLDGIPVPVVEKLSWGDRETTERIVREHTAGNGFDIIVGADVAMERYAAQPLCDQVVHLLELSPPACEFLMSYEFRVVTMENLGKPTVFEVAAPVMTVEPLEDVAVPDEFLAENPVSLWRFSRKPVSDLRSPLLPPEDIQVVS